MHKNVRSSKTKSARAIVRGGGGGGLTMPLWDTERLSAHSFKCHILRYLQDSLTAIMCVIISKDFRYFWISYNMIYKKQSCHSLYRISMSTDFLS